MLVFPLRGRRLLLTAGLVLGAGLATAPAASAKTFTALPQDQAGDAASGSQDIVSARIAYNRRSGALSVSVTTADAIDQTDHDAAIAVVLSDLRGGKCHVGLVGMAGAFSSTRSFGIGMNGGRVNGKKYNGSASVDGDTFSMRVRNKKLAGQTVGCVAVVLLSTTEKDADGSPKLLDATNGNDGFI